LYGSDYPFGGEAGEDVVRENLNGVRTLDVSLEDMAKILGGNAKKLLKIR
jgi:predicted TIM-barrel fold metal-dependent hydrolase